jgi:peroxiredoxin
MSLPAKGRRTRAVVEALAVVAFLMVLSSLRSSSKTIVGQAPPIDGTGVDGSALSLASLRGRPTLVHFWSTWCPVCKLEDKSLDSLARDHAVLTVAVDSGSAAEVASWMNQRGLRFATIADEDGHLAKRYGVRGLPTTFVLDQQGEVRFAETGYTSGLGLRARLWWAGRKGR